jgi:nucleolin
MPYSYSREDIEAYWAYCGEIESLDMLTFPDSGRFRGIAFITFKEQAGYEAALACDGEALDGQTLKVGRPWGRMKPGGGLPGGRGSKRPGQGAQRAARPGSSNRSPPIALPRPLRVQVDKCKAAASAPKRGGGGSTPAAAAPAASPAAAAAARDAGGDGGGANRGGRAGGSGRPQKAPGYNVAYVGNVAFEVTRDELAEVFADCGVKLVRLHTDQATGRSKGYAHVHFEDEAGLDRAMELDGHVLQGRGIRVSYGQPKRS